MEERSFMKTVLRAVHGGTTQQIAQRIPSLKSYYHSSVSLEWCRTPKYLGREGRHMPDRGPGTQKPAANSDINWVTTFFMAACHVGAIAALFFFTWKALFAAIVLWWISGSLGIGMGYHRLLTHRGYRTPKWVEYFLTF